MTTLTELAAAYPGLARVDSLRYSSGLGKPLVHLVISGNVTSRQTLHPMVKLVGRYQDAVGLYLICFPGDGFSFVYQRLDDNPLSLD